MHDGSFPGRQVATASWLFARFLRLVHATASDARALTLYLLIGSAALCLINLSLAIVLAAGAVAVQLLSRPAALLASTRASWVALVAAPCAAFLLVFVARQPVALDDLLRDIAVARYGFDYRLVYRLSAPSLPDFSLWWGFDRALAVASHAVGSSATMWLTQAAAAAALIGATAAATWRDCRYQPGAPIVVSAVLLVVAALAVHRISLGRPEIFAAAWCVAAAAVASRHALMAWSIGGVLLSLSYWLFPLYIVAAWLLRLSVRARIAIAAALTAFHFVAWYLISDGAYLATLLWLPQILESQIAPVAENLPFTTYLASPLFVLLLCGAAVSFFLSARARVYVALAAFFMASEQVRYVGVVAPFLAMACAAGFGRYCPRPDRATVVVGSLVAVLVAVHIAQQPARMSGSPRFDLPTGSLTLTAFGHASFAVPFFSSGTPGVEPSYAFGAAPAAVQHLVVSLSKGALSCDALLAQPFTHVLENTLSSPVACLALLDVQGPWRLWRVSPGGSLP